MSAKTATITKNIAYLLRELRSFAIFAISVVT